MIFLAMLRANLNLIRCQRFIPSVTTPFSTTVQDQNGGGDQKTALYDFHVTNGGKMVNFAGYLLPVQYEDLGIAASHLHTRKHASVFDVSHMLQTYVTGKHAIECLESICTADIQELPNGTGTLTVFTGDHGTILDDLIVTKVAPNQLYIVSNAAMKSQDTEIIRNSVNSFKSSGKDVDVRFLDPSEMSLLAVQGPSTASILQKIVTDVDFKRFYFMNSMETNVTGIGKCIITRCGYTGEDGVEISVPSQRATELINLMLTGQETNDKLRLAGLGARDSLRIEAGLCLYGTDIDRTKTPVEASLAWLIGKRRRAEGNFPGAKIIAGQLQAGVAQKRIGFRLLESGPPARHGTEIWQNGRQEKIGTVTSGIPSPSLGNSIGMGYIRSNFTKVGTKVQLKVRDKFYHAEIVKMPFVPSKYFVKPKQ